MNTDTGYHTSTLLISIVLLMTFGSRSAGHGQSTADATLRGLTVSPVDIAGFSSDAAIEYHVGVANSVTQVTVTATATDAGATIEIGKDWFDKTTVASGSGQVVSLDEGVNRVYVWVTSQDGNTRKGYTIVVGRGVVSSFGWKAVDDFNTLRAAGNDASAGIWSDGATMWVADQEDVKLYAYNVQTKARDAAKDFDTLVAAGQKYPHGIWSDGATMWVADWSVGKLFAYNLATRARDASRDIDSRSTGGSRHPEGIWSDGTTMWVANSHGGKLYAHNMASNSRDAAKDFNTLTYGGIWSDGATMWVTGDDPMLYAYSLSTKRRWQVLEFDKLEDLYINSGYFPTGTWSDGTTMWVADRNGKIFSFNMPQEISYDSDGDGLIEISRLEQLNVIRWDTNGDGAADSGTDAAAYAAAFPRAAAGMGCPTTTEDADDSDCTGYELKANLDFDTSGDGRVNAADDYWNGGAGWAPIGSFAATFEGNGHTITRLYINRAAPVGLFGRIGAGGQVRNVGMRQVSVTGSDRGDVGGLAGANWGSIVSSYLTGAVTGSGNYQSVGGLVGQNWGIIVSSYTRPTRAVTGSGVYLGVGGLVGSNYWGSILSSYSTGAVAGSGSDFVGGDLAVGGLVGRNLGSIVSSYATGAVTSSGNHHLDVGGLVGRNLGSIVSSYATGAVTGSGNYLEVGGLSGDNFSGSIVASYWNTETSGQASSGGGIGQRTVALQTPTGYTGIYASWNVDLDNADGDCDPTTGGDDPWDFGTVSAYPKLRVYRLRTDLAVDGAATWPLSGRVAPPLCQRTPQVRGAIVAAVSGVSSVNDVTTAHLGAITSLDLSRRSITELQADDFAGLTALTGIALPDNQLGTLPADLFDGLTALERLDLDRNQLSTLPADLLDGLTALKWLHLEANQLSTVPPDLLDDLTALKWIYLSSNQLSALPADLFEGTTALTRIGLSGNQLSALPADLFDGLTALEWLYLGGNPLSALPADVFDGLSALTVLYLDNGQFVTLPPDLFEGLSALKGLFLFRNQLSALPPDLFDGLTALELLYLDTNQLGALPANLFVGLTALTQLRLQDNRVSSLPANLFVGLTALELLYLHGNSVDPLPLAVSLEKVGADQIKATAPTGAPFELVLPLTVANGSLSGGATTITVPAGSLESQPGTVTRTSGTTAAVTIDIGTWPGLPTNHSGYTLVKSGNLPLEVSGSVDTSTATSATDFNGDGKTDFADFFLFIDAYGGTDSRFDLDGNGTVDFADFFQFIDGFDPTEQAKLVAMARESIGLPGDTELQQSWPNPFNSETVISWFLLEPGPARVEVFALTGQRVAVLHEGPLRVGYHRLPWDGRDDAGRPLASGVYLYRLVTREGVLTRKLTLLR